MIKKSAICAWTLPQSLDLREVVTHKAHEAWKQVGGTVLVEDTSLTFHALGQLPGPLIKWFLVSLDSAGMCQLLDGYDDRSATARVCVGLYDGTEHKLFEGERKGSIAATPRGAKGFGSDPIFIPEGSTKTWGEMDPEEQKQTSMRRIALKQLEEYVRASVG